MSKLPWTFEPKKKIAPANDPMTPQEKAKKLADFYTQIAAGKTVQARCLLYPEQWYDIPENAIAFVGTPNMGSNLDNWRIKPEVQKCWSTFLSDTEGLVEDIFTFSKKEAEEWKANGYEVTEWINSI